MSRFPAPLCSRCISDRLNGAVLISGRSEDEVIWALFSTVLHSPFLEPDSRGAIALFRLLVGIRRLPDRTLTIVPSAYLASALLSSSTFGMSLL
jgi:hypothetical protein